MLRAIYIIIFIVCCRTLGAQEKNFGISTLPETTMVSLLLKEARSIGKKSLDSAIGLSKKALLISKGSNQPSYIIEATLNLGAYQYERKAYSQCKALYAYLIEHHRSDMRKSKSLLPLVYNNLANVYLKQGYQDSAIYYYYQSLTAIKRSGSQNKVMLSLLYSNLGAALAVGSQRKQALFYLSEALVLPRQLKDTNLIAQNILNIDITHEDIRNYETALDYYNDALRLFAERKTRLIFKVPTGL